MWKKTIFSLAICTIATVTNAQKTTQVNVLQSAFKKSYESEYNLKYAKAIEELTPVYDTKSYELNLRLGWLNYLNIKYVASLEFYKKCIELAPKSIEAKLGVIYPLANLERWDEVMVQYNEILKLDPTNMTANFQLALINYNRKDYAQALPYITTYVSSYPFNFDGVNLMGWIHYASGKKDVAKTYFQKALLINPSSKNYELLPEMK